VLHRVLHPKAHVNGIEKKKKKKKKKKNTLHPEDASNATQKEQVTGTAKIHNTTIISSILKNKNKKD
jgi:hypothetical protein